MLSSCSSSSSSLAFHGSLPPPFSEKNGRSNGRSSKASESRRFPPAALPSPSAHLPLPSVALRIAIPMAASIPILLWTIPVNAGFFSGFPGLESAPAPQLPEVDFLKKWNDENQKKYAEFDSRFRSSNVLKDLLEKSKLNKERNEKEIRDKYCLRGAEWGVGDCSAQGMTEEERASFIQTLKKNINDFNSKGTK